MSFSICLFSQLVPLSLIPIWISDSVRRRKMKWVNFVVPLILVRRPYRYSASEEITWESKVFGNTKFRQYGLRLRSIQLRCEILLFIFGILGGWLPLSAATAAVDPLFSGICSPFALAGARLFLLLSTTSWLGFIAARLVLFTTAAFAVCFRF